jgi:hypothetical protein
MPPVIPDPLPPADLPETGVAIMAATQAMRSTTFPPASGPEHHSAIGSDWRTIYRTVITRYAYTQRSQKAPDNPYDCIDR